MTENLLHDIPGVVIYLNYVLIMCPDDDSHMAVLEEVLHRMEQACLHLSQNMCRFMSNSVEYLGYKVDAEGIQPLPGKV